MIRKIDSKNMGSSNLGWLKSTFHFSFAEYYNPKNIQFGVLRVINDDLIQPNTGFDTHPHQNMEIISYVIDGELTHGDSMGNKNTISRGHVQYMSAGTGVLHSEFNMGKDMLRLLQIWILPDRHGHTPQYGEVRFDWNDRKNNWLHMVSGVAGDAPIKIKQDANIYALELEEGKKIDFSIEDNRQAYLVQIEGTSDLNGIPIATRDGVEVIEEDITIHATAETAHLLLIEMEKHTEI